MEPIVFIDSLDNISIVNLDVPSLSPPPPSDQLCLTDTDDYEPMPFLMAAIGDSLDPFADAERADAAVAPLSAVEHGHHRNRRIISSLDKVRTWKKYAKKKHLTQAELDRKRDLANKQERRRMHRLNEALDKLRKVIPVELQHPPRRLSKIKTLQSAIKYIKWLQDKLDN